MKKSQVTLTGEDRATLESLLAKGALPVKTFTRATALLERDRGKTLHEVADTLGITYNTVAHWRDAYTTRGLACLHDAPRSGRPLGIDGAQRAKITALACRDAPEGQARWSLRLLAEKVVEAGICDEVSHTFVGDVLTKTTESRTSETLGALASSMPPCSPGLHTCSRSMPAPMMPPIRWSASMNAPGS